MRAAGIIVVQEARGPCRCASVPDAGFSFCNRNLALLDVLGASVLKRVISRLHRYGVQPISVVSNSDLANSPQLDWDPTNADLEYTGSGDLWTSVEHLLFQYAKQDVEALVLMLLGAYAELNYLDVLQLHRRNGKMVTSVFDTEGPLHVAVFDLKRPVACRELIRNLCGGSFFHLSRSSVSLYAFAGYVNRLESPNDVRELTKDALEARCELRPVGREVRPGVWLGPSAQVHTDARVVAPIYIGAHSKIRPATVITSTSSVEHHCEVDCGTFIDQSNVLPFSYLGPGLAARHTLVDGARLLHLAHKLELEVRDPRLLSRRHSPMLTLRLKGEAIVRTLRGLWVDSLAAAESPGVVAD